MKFDKQAMITAFLQEMEELNAEKAPPSRTEIELQFSKLLQVNVKRGHYEQQYCDELSNTMLTLSDEEIFAMYEVMIERFPFLEV